jgi:hypothetical protein
VALLGTHIDRYTTLNLNKANFYQYILKPSQGVRSIVCTRLAMFHVSLSKLAESPSPTSPSFAKRAVKVRGKFASNLRRLYQFLWTGLCDLQVKPIESWGANVTDYYSAPLY